VVFRIGFVVFILRFDKENEQQEMKTYVLLGCEKGGEHVKYRNDLEVIVTSTRKYDCPFKLQEN